MPLLEVKETSVLIRRNRTAFPALAPVSFTMEKGESLAVTGKSGAGKTTLAHVILGMTAPETGSVWLDGQLWADAQNAPSRQHRNLVQSVPQDAQSSFVPRWTIGKSLAFTARRLRPEVDADQLIDRAIKLANFDQALLDRRPHQISGGQAQRAAIARALVPEPALIVADEPTSALDTTTGKAVISSLLELTQTTETSLLAVTHDPYFASRCDRIITLEPATPQL